MRPSSTGDSERPIGYWLKAADEAITACVDAVHRAEGITRRDWQVLNTIFEAGRLSPDRILDTLRMFLDRGGLDAVLDALRSRGWIHEEADGEVGLTETGRQAHARILARQQEVRQRLMQGISAEEYTTVLRVLKQIVANLG
ncbi:MAG: MarR family transcriptional regulator [Acidobacteriota bacterium]|jgi:DNA-binding MarR family transcriptional regulator|nr:MAG: MarR family transcriptional regulator [Acidobacteriota bacterium]